MNDRFIKSPYLNHSVNSAFEGLVAKDSFPFYVIFLDVDPKTIDINVHPTKTEIKFEDERLVYSVLRSAVKKSLGVNNFEQPLDFRTDTNFLSTTTFEATEQSNSAASSIDAVNSLSFKKEKPEDNWQQLYEGLETTTQNPQENALTFSSGMNDSESSDNFERSGNVLQILNKYIVTQIKSGMLMIDQHAAHQRVLYEKYAGMLKNKFGASQQFLFPQTIELSPTDHSLVIELDADIRALGFVFNDFGQNTIVLNGIPADAPSGKEKELFEGLLQSYKDNKGELKLDTHENLARALSKRSAIKPGTKLGDEEMKNIIDELFACTTPEYSPDGEKAMYIMKEDDLKHFLS